MKPQQFPQSLLARILILAMLVSTLPPGAPVAKAEPGGASVSPPLCNPKDPYTGRAGFGGEIVTWSEPINSDGYNKKAKALVQKYKKEILDGSSQAHTQYEKLSELLRVANQNRALFFTFAFGAPARDKQESVLFQVCGAKKLILEKLAAKDAALKEANLKVSKITSCEGAPKAVLENYRSAASFYKHYAEVLGKITGGPNDGYRENTVYAQYRDLQSADKIAVDDQELAKKTSAINGQFRLSFNAKKSATKNLRDVLIREYEMLWGLDPIRKISSSAGYYSQFYAELLREKELGAVMAADFDKNSNKLAELAENCKTTGDGSLELTDGKDSGNNDGPDITGDLNKDEKITGGTSTDTNTNTNTNTDTTTCKDKNANGDCILADMSGGGDTTDEQPPVPEEERSGGKGVTGFMKDNWMWLAGGAAAAGGGAYLYKKHRDREKTKDRWNDDSKFMPKTTVTATSTGTSTSGQVSIGATVPAGARLLLTNAVLGPSAGQAMAAIELAVVDANGVQQDVSGLAVEASCLTPTPCSLAGAKSVTTANGKVIFSGLVFNQPDQNVVLQFTAPGVSSVSTPKFNVQGSSARE